MNFGKPTGVIALAGHGDEPTDDGTPTEGENTPQDGEAGDPPANDEADKSNEPIELPDTKNLAIDDIIEQTEQKHAEEDEALQAQRLAELKESTSEASLIGTAIESYLNDVKTRSVSKPMTLGVLNSIRRRLGQPRIAQETFDSYSPGVVVESFSDARTALLEKIRNTAGLVRSTVVRQIKQHAEMAAQLSSEQRAAVAKISSSQPKKSLVIDPTIKARLSVHGVYFADAPLPRYTPNGEKADSLEFSPMNHIRRAGELLNFMMFYDHVESRNLPDSIQELLHRFRHGNYHDVQSMKSVLPDPQELVRIHQMPRVSFIDGHRCEDDRQLFATMDYLGGVNWVFELDARPWGNDPISRLGAMSSWHSGPVRYNADTNNNTVRFLYKEEVVACQEEFEKIAKLSEGLLDFADRYDQTVSKLMQSLQDVEGATNQIVTNDDMLERQQLVLIAIKACVAWLSNSASASSFVCRHMTHLQQAWLGALRAQADSETI